MARLIAAMPEGVQSVYVRDVGAMKACNWRSVIDLEADQADGPATDLCQLVRAAGWAGDLRLHALGGSAFVLPQFGGGSSFFAREIFVTAGKQTGGKQTGGKDVGGKLAALRSTLQDPSTKQVLERTTRDGLMIFRGGPDAHWAHGPKNDDPPRGESVFVCLPDDQTIVLAPTLDECVSMAQKLTKAATNEEIEAALKARWGRAAKAIDDASPLVIMRAIDPNSDDWMQRKAEDARNPPSEWPPRDVIVLTTNRRAPIKLELRLFGDDFDIPSYWLRMALGLNRTQEITDQGVLVIIADPFMGHAPKQAEEGAGTLWMRTMMVFGVAISI